MKNSSKKETILEPDKQVKDDLIRSENEGFSNMYESEKEKESQELLEKIQNEEEPMSIVKVIEIISQSPNSWEDAAQKAIEEVTRTVRDVQSIYIQDFQATVESNKISNYRVTAKISFVVQKGS
jgi:flavin-binding protein dodecin